MGDKYRGTLKRCIEQYVRERLEGRTDLDDTRAFITHTAIDKEMVETARAVAAECFPFKEVIETDAGSTIASHCGPGTLGILFIRK